MFETKTTFENNQFNVCVYSVGQCCATCKADDEGTIIEMELSPGRSFLVSELLRSLINVLRENKCKKVSVKKDLAVSAGLAYFRNFRFHEVNRDQQPSPKPNPNPKPLQLRLDL